MHFFDEAMDLVPADDQFQVKKMQYASPGFIRVAVHRPIAGLISRGVELVADRSSAANQEYTALGSYIRTNGLNNLKQDSEDWGKYDNELSTRTKRLLDALGVDNSVRLLSLVDRPFEAAKIARAIFVRLDILAGYQNADQIRLPRR